MKRKTHLIQKLKRPLFACVCWLFYYSGLFQLVQRIRLWQGKSLTIFMFHRISDGQHFGLPAITLSRTHFISFLQFLKKHYQICPLEPTLERFYRRQKFSSPLAALTFDDGYKETLYQALPLLQRENVPSLCFIATDFPERVESFWWDRTYVFLRYAPWPMVQKLIHSSESYQELEDKWKPLIFLEGTAREDFIESCIHQLQEQEPALLEEFQANLKIIYSEELERDYPVSRSLSWNEISFLPKYGMEVGSHTLSHRNLSQLSASEQDKEIIRSKKVLEQHLKGISRLFCYPAGKYNSEIIQKVQEAGYEGALTTGTGLNSPLVSPFELRRINVWDGLVEDFQGEFSKTICAWRLTWI